METIDKATNSAHKSADKRASSTNQAALALCGKNDLLNKAEQQLMKNFRRYARYNPWVMQ